MPDGQRRARPLLCSFDRPWPAPALALPLISDLDDFHRSAPVQGLQLDIALKLLAQSGHPLPVADDPAWLQAVVDALCDLSSRDALTTLANRHQFEIELAREIARVARAGEAALLLMVDIDHFKAVNDVHGHAAGDRVIKAVALTLLDCVRPMDTVARFGGEEFAIILPNCAAGFGETVAERIRTRVEQTAVEVTLGQSISVTISLGGAFAPQWVRTSAVLWTNRADQQLYRAKAAGRNRACLEQSVGSPVSAEEKSLLFDMTRMTAGSADAAPDENLA